MAVNPNSGMRAQAVHTVTRNCTPADGRILLMYHSKPIKIINLWMTPVTAGTTPVFTVALQSFSVATGTDITTKATSSASAGVTISVCTLAASATLTRSSAEILALNFSSTTGTPVDTIFTLEYQELDA